MLATIHLLLSEPNPEDGLMAEIVDEKIDLLVLGSRTDERGEGRLGAIAARCARLSPVRLTRKLEEDEIARLFEATRETLLEWTDRLRFPPARELRAGLLALLGDDFGGAP